jgi:transposase
VGWELVQLNPAHVTEQRRVLGKRTIKTDVIDLQAMTELLLAGRGQPVRERSLVLGELTAWSAHRSGRVVLRTATKNQLLGQLDRSFPGLARVLPDVLGTKVGRLVAAEFPDPARLAALGSTRFIRFGAARGLQIRRPMAHRLVQAARDALPTADAAVARAILAADLALLADLDAQVEQATDQLARLLPVSPFAPPLTVPGWGAVRAGNYGGALGDPARFDHPRQVYRSARVSTRSSTSRPPDAATARSVTRAASSCAARSSTSAWGCGSTIPPPRSTALSCAPAARRARSSAARWHTEPTASPSPSSVTRAPTTPADGSERTDTPLHNSGRQCQARGHEGPGPDTAPAMAGAARRHAATSLAPGSFALAAARTKPDDPHPHSEIAYVSVGAPAPDSHRLTAKNSSPNPTRVDQPCPPSDLTRTTAS